MYSNIMYKTEASIFTIVIELKTLNNTVYTDAKKKILTCFWFEDYDMNSRIKGPYKLILNLVCFVIKIYLIR